MFGICFGKNKNSKYWPASIGKSLLKEPALNAKKFPLEDPSASREKRLVFFSILFYKLLPSKFFFTDSLMEKGHWKNSSQALFWSALALASKYSSNSSLMSSGRLKTSRYLAYWNPLLNFWATFP